MFGEAGKGDEAEMGREAEMGGLNPAGPLGSSRKFAPIENIYIRTLLPVTTGFPTWHCIQPEKVSILKFRFLSSFENVHSSPNSR